MRTALHIIKAAGCPYDQTIQSILVHQLKSLFLNQFVVGKDANCHFTGSFHQFFYPLARFMNPFICGTNSGGIFDQDFAALPNRSFRHDELDTGPFGNAGVTFYQFQINRGPFVNLAAGGWRLSTDRTRRKPGVHSFTNRAHT